MKIRIFSLTAVILLFFCASMSAQVLDVVDPNPAPGDSTVFNIELLPLVSKTKFNATPAFYKHLFIFGDGNFLFGESQEKASFKHRYGVPPSNFIQNYFARAYSTGVYSEPEEPPIVAAPPIIPPVSGSITNKTVVDTNRYLKILRNVQVKPGDPFVSILAVHNPTNDTLSGQLYFLYNGRIRTVSKTATISSPNFSAFDIRNNFFYQSKGQQLPATYFYTNQGPVSTAFQNMLLIELTELYPGEEYHYFIDMKGDPAMMDVFASTEKAEMDFAAVFASLADSAPLIPDSLQNDLNSLELLEFVGNINIGQTTTPPIAADSVTFYQPQEDASFDGDIVPPQQSVAKLLDYYVSSASLVKSHDPNFMLMEACACSEESERHQIFTTVQCENTGFGETTNIYMDIKLPAGVSADDVVVSPVQYHPYGSNADQISFIKLSDDSIRWELLNFGIEGTPLHGVGDPRTFANVQFNMYSSVEPSLLDSIHACIRFDDLANDPVCTVPVAVSLTASKGQVLQCATGECGDDPGQKNTWPWWVWVIIFLIILLLIIWLLRRRN